MSNVAAPEASAPGNVAPAAPATPSVDTFLEDSKNALPDALAGMLPTPKPPKGVRAAPVEVPSETTATTQPAITPATETAPAASPEGVATQPEGTVTAPEATPETTTTEGQPTTQPSETAAKEFTKNWRIKAKDAKQALFIQLMQNGIDPQEAIKEVYGDTQTTTTAQPATPTPQPQVDPFEQADQQISALATEVADFEAKIDEAAEKGDTAAALKLQREQSRKEALLQRAKDNRQALKERIERDQFQAEVNHFERLKQESLDRVFERHPDLSKKTSEQRAQFNAVALRLEKDPAYGKDFYSRIAGWPELVARIAAEEHGWNNRTVTPPPLAQPRQTQPTVNPIAKPPTTTPATNPLRVTSAEVVSSSTSPGGTTPTLGIDTFLRDSETAKPEDLYALLAKAPLHPKIVEMAKRDPRTRQYVKQ